VVRIIRRISTNVNVGGVAIRYKVEKMLANSAVNEKGRNPHNYNTSRPKVPIRFTGAMVPNDAVGRSVNYMKFDCLVIVCIRGCGGRARRTTQNVVISY